MDVNDNACNQTERGALESFIAWIAAPGCRAAGIGTRLVLPARDAGGIG
jgi:hypothetical protein